MNEDLTKLESELQALAGHELSPALVRRINASLALPKLRLSGSDWLLACTMFAGAVAAVAIVVLFATALPLHGPATPTGMGVDSMAWRHNGSDPFLAMLNNAGLGRDSAAPYAPYP
jgi:hypothetical protein